MGGIEDVIDHSPKLGTRWSSTAGASPLSVKSNPKSVSRKQGNEMKLKTCCSITYGGGGMGRTASSGAHH